MSPELSGLLIELVMVGALSPINLRYTREVANELGPLGLILYSRLPETVEITRGVAFLACHLSGGNPGRLVMWAFTLSELHRRKNKMIDINAFIDAFPDGFPSGEDYSIMWDEQKSSTGANRLDNPAEWVNT
jgi:hypothetical protein